MLFTHVAKLLIPRSILNILNTLNIVISLFVLCKIYAAVQPVKPEPIIAKGKHFDQAIKLEKAESSDVESEIAKIVNEKPGLSIGGYMGLIMAKFKGKVSGKEATDILNKLLKK